MKNVTDAVSSGDFGTLTIKGVVVGVSIGIGLLLVKTVEKTYIRHRNKKWYKQNKEEPF